MQREILKPEVNIPLVVKLDFGPEPHCTKQFVLLDLQVTAVHWILLEGVVRMS